MTIEEFLESNGIKPDGDYAYEIMPLLISWGALTKEQYRVDAERYREARQIGVTFVVERWAGFRRETSSYEELDAILDRRIKAKETSKCTPSTSTT